MTTDNADTLAALEAHGQALAAIARNLRQATAIQWDRAPGRPASVDPLHVGGALDPNYYPRSQTDAKVATPGNITPGTVTASGDVTTTGAVSATGQVTGGRVVSTQPLQSIGSYNYQVTSGYKAGWINSDGQIGFSPSTIRVKKDLEPLPDDLADAALGMGAYLGRYTWDDDDSPLKLATLRRGSRRSTTRTAGAE